MLGRFAKFIDASIGRRLALGLSTTLLAGLAISTFFFVRAERHEMQVILEVKARTALNLVEPRLAHVFNRDKPEPLRFELQALVEDRDFDFAFVYDDERVVAKVSDPGEPWRLSEPPPALNRLRKKRFVVRTTGDTMEVYTPVLVDGKRVAGLGLGVSLGLQARQVRLVRIRLLAVTALLLLGAIGVVYWWTRSTVAPLRKLTRGAQAIAEGDLTVRVPVNRFDEVGRLASTFNLLAESLQHTLQDKDQALAETRRLYRNLKVARAQLGRAERLSAVGMLAAGVSHELNNPLGIILSTAGNLREALGAAHPSAEDVAIIEAETKRCRAIIQGLLNFAASGESHPLEIDINNLLRETFTLAVRDERAHALSVSWQLDSSLPKLWVDPRQMQQVFLNLLMNAADAMGGSGEVTIRTAESIEGGRRKVQVAFTDRGCGIGPADLEHVFDPFYTTKKGGAGYGLGLAVSYGIIASHGGDVTVASELGHGTTFTITLPLRADSRRSEVAMR